METNSKAWLCHHGQKEVSGTQTERQNEDIACDEKKSTFSFRARKVDTFHSVFLEHEQSCHFKKYTKSGLISFKCPQEDPPKILNSSLNYLQSLTSEQ